MYLSTVQWRGRQYEDGTQMLASSHMHGRDEEGTARSTDEVMIKRVVLKRTIVGGARRATARSEDASSHNWAKLKVMTCVKRLW